MKTPAVVIRVAGGLGNQLFQYAFGRALSLRAGVPLVLDGRSAFPRDFYRRQFTLARYRLPAGCLSDVDDFSTVSGRLRRRLARRINAWLPLSRRWYVEEPDPFRYAAGIAAMPIRRRVHFEGYWQHEEYFAAARPALIDDLTLAEPVSEPTREVAARIADAGPAAVCLHVRRLLGVPNVPDARPLPHDPAIHLDAAYYDRAVSFLAERIAAPHFFVFADFPPWAREHLQLPGRVTFVQHNGPDRDYEDLWLMSRCRAFIVANSTFSWWGAWLANHADRIVVAPAAGIGCGLKSIPRSWHAL